MDLAGVIVAVICIFCAIYIFDTSNLNICIAAVLLFFAGVQTLSSNEKLKKVLRVISIFLLVFLLCKILIGA